MPSIPARLEQLPIPNSLFQLVNEALRAAATAPTIIDALDIAGDALHAVAEFGRAEVRHG